MGIDPACHMEVDEQTAKWKTTHLGKTYYFCASGWQKAFEANPDKYLETQYLRLAPSLCGGGKA